MKEHGWGFWVWVIETDNTAYPAFSWGSVTSNLNSDFNDFTNSICLLPTKATIGTFYLIFYGGCKYHKCHQNHIMT